MLPPKAISALIDIKKELLSKESVNEGAEIEGGKVSVGEMTRHSSTMRHARRPNAFQRMCQRRDWASPIYCLLIALSLFATITFAQTRAHYRRHGKVLLNDLDVTPGLVRTTDRNADGICHGTTKPYRKAGIQAVYGIYGATKVPGKYEIDHLISLELGGDNGIENEWPQPYEPRPGAHEKDKVENWLNAQVCSGKMELKEAQRAIATDWYAVYVEMNKLPKGTSGAN